MTNRIVSLDFTKGALVVFMVIYHGLNYLGYESLPHVFLSFVPPSFIMIAGFIITHVYVPRKGAASKGLAGRLTIRSLKLVMLFTLLNVGAVLVFSPVQGGAAPRISDFVGRLSEIYIIGGSRWAAFEVLLPIGYLLLLSIAVLRLHSRIPSAVAGAAVVLVAGCLAAEHYGYPVYNLYMISAGFVGMTIGLMRDSALRAAYRSWTLPAFLYGLYWLAFLMLGDRYGMQLFATLASVLLIYAAGSRVDPHRWMPEQILTMGRYSLLAYIVQIFFLQLFKRSPLFGEFGVLGAVVVILATAILTWGTVRVVDWIRLENALVDRAYRLIFA